MRKVRIFCQY